MAQVPNNVTYHILNSAGEEMPVDVGGMTPEELGVLFARLNREGDSLLVKGPPGASFDIVIREPQLPDVEGTSVCTAMREEWDRMHAGLPKIGDPWFVAPVVEQAAAEPPPDPVILQPELSEADRAARLEEWNKVKADLDEDYILKAARLELLGKKINFKEFL